MDRATAAKQKLTNLFKIMKLNNESNKSKSQVTDNIKRRKHPKTVKSYSHELVLKGDHFQELLRPSSETNLEVINFAYF